jgi:SCP-2 sterol transfer family
MRGLGTRLLALLVRRADDARIERWFGPGAIQRGLFAAIVSGFDPSAAGSFQGCLVYELQRPATARPSTRWTIEVAGGHATARPGAAAEPALTLRIRLADFVRIAAGLLDPAIPLLHDRATLDGDLGLAARLPEIFRAPRPLSARRRAPR